MLKDCSAPRYRNPSKPFGFRDSLYSSPLFQHRVFASVRDNLSVNSSWQSRFWLATVTSDYRTAWCRFDPLYSIYHLSSELSISPGFCLPVRLPSYLPACLQWPACPSISTVFICYNGTSSNVQCVRIR